MALATDPVPRCPCCRVALLPGRVAAGQRPAACVSEGPCRRAKNATNATPLRNAREQWLRLRHVARVALAGSRAAVALRQPSGVVCPAMKLSAEKKRRFCEALVRGQTPDLAAQAIGINGATVYRWRASDPSFAAAWLDAREHKTEVVEN